MHFSVSNVNCLKPNISDTSTIASYINTYGVLPAQFIYNNEIFVSTFIGDGFNWATVAADSKPLFACPNYQAASLASSSGVSCLFSWDAVRDFLLAEKKYLCI